MTSIDIANMAVAYLGQTQSISSMTESSVGAIACNRFYNNVRTYLLKSYPWNFAVKTATLTEVTDETDDAYSYVYEYPTDCLRVIKVGNEGDSLEIHNEFNVRLNDETPPLMRIACDIDDAKCSYIYDVQNVDAMPSEFQDALALLLAVRISPVLASDAKLANSVLQQAQIAIASAKAMSAGERRNPKPTTNRYCDARF